MPATETRTIEVRLDPSAAERYDAGLSGSDTDLLLAIEKTIVSKLFPERRVTGGLSGEDVDLDPDLVEVGEGD